MACRLQNPPSRAVTASGSDLPSPVLTARPLAVDCQAPSRHRCSHSGPSGLAEGPCSSVPGPVGHLPGPGQIHGARCHWHFAPSSGSAPGGPPFREPTFGQGQQRTSVRRSLTGHCPFLGSAGMASSSFEDSLSWLTQSQASAIGATMEIIPTPRPRGDWRRVQAGGPKAQVRTSVRVTSLLRAGSRGGSLRRPHRPARGECNLRVLPQTPHQRTSSAIAVVSMTIFPSW